MIQVINRALDILEYCSKHPEKEYSLSEIADHFHLNHATCANILKTLVNRRYIEQVGHKKGYRLGSMAYYLTGNFSFRSTLVEVAKPVMKDLCDILNETVILAVYNKHDNKRIVLHTVYCDHELQVRSNREKNAYDTSTGRLIMAYLPKDDRMNIVKHAGLPSPFIWKDVTSLEEFEAESEKIRKEGIVFQKTTSHVVGIAVPLFYKERVIAGLGIYLPEVRFHGELKALIIDHLRYSAKKISEDLNQGTLY